MASQRVTSSQFQKEYGRYSTLAKRQPLTITNHGRDELVILDAQEYQRLLRLDAGQSDEQQREE
jgi:PHD/YefM family antitoxin component YafN of YafNO toxin-antitoxin module